MNVFAAFPQLCLAVGRPDHLVHVGAHTGQEVPFYRQAAARKITLVEPNPTLAAQLRAGFPDASVVECACGSTRGRAQLYMMEPTNLSTLQTPSVHDPVQRLIEVDVQRLDQVAPTADVAVIDVQGRELDVLKGAPWPTLRVVIVETCTVDDPTMASGYGEVSLLMADHGFYELARWVRDYDQVNAWARGPGQPRRGGEIRDVVFVRKNTT